MFCLYNTSNIIYLLSFAVKESNKENLFCFFTFSLCYARCRLRRRLRLLKYFRRHLPSLRRLMRLAPPKPEGRASVTLVARQFLAIAYFATLVTTADLAGLTALNFLILLILIYLSFLQLLIINIMNSLFISVEIIFKFYFPCEFGDLRCQGTQCTIRLYGKFF